MNSVLTGKCTCRWTCSYRERRAFIIRMNNVPTGKCTCRWTCSYRERRAFIISLAQSFSPSYVFLSLHRYILTAALQPCSSVVWTELQSCFINILITIITIWKGKPIESKSIVILAQFQINRQINMWRWSRE